MNKGAHVFKIYLWQKKLNHVYIYEIKYLKDFGFIRVFKFEHNNIYYVQYNHYIVAQIVWSNWLKMRMGLYS
jgi:hypothetical protein